MSTSQPMFWPSLRPSITELPGSRGGTHSGIDLAADLGDPVIAPCDGVTVFVGGDGATRMWLDGAWLYANGEGKTIDIRRADGLISRVGHLNGYAIQQGQTVKAGQVIGFAGKTGYSTGVHIHWETRWDRAWSGGKWVDPRLFNPQVFDAVEHLKGVPMPALIRNHDGSVGFVSDNGTLDPITTMNEVESLKATGIVGDWVQMPDGNIWNTLAARTVRLKSRDIDEAKLAVDVAALLISPVVEALSGKGNLSKDDVKDVVSEVMAGILKKAAQ